MPSSGWPSTRTSPEDGCNSPAATFSSVDLPQPVGPTTETNSPLPTARVVSLTAVYRSPCRSREANAQVTRSRSSAGVLIRQTRRERESSLFLVFGQRFLGVTIVESLRELDVGRLDRRVECGEILERVLRSCLGKHSVGRIGIFKLDEARYIDVLVAKQVFRRYGLDDVVGRGLLDPKQRAHHGVGQRLHRVRILLDEADRRIKGAGRHVGTPEYFFGAFRRARIRNEHHRTHFLQLGNHWVEVRHSIDLTAG